MWIKAIPPINTKLYIIILTFLNEYHIFVFKPMTLKFGKVTNFLDTLSDDRTYFSMQLILNIHTQSPAHLEQG